MNNKKKYFLKYKNSFNLLITWRLLAETIDKYKKVLKNNNINYKILTKPQYLIEKDLLKVINKFDGIICGDDEITDKVIDKAKNLKIISKWGTGTDSINIDYAKKRNCCSKFTWSFYQVSGSAWNSINVCSYQKYCYQS